MVVVTAANILSEIEMTDQQVVSLQKFRNLAGMELCGLGARAEAAVVKTLERGRNRCHATGENQYQQAGNRQEIPGGVTMSVGSAHGEKHPFPFSFLPCHMLKRTFNADNRDKTWSDYFSR